MAGDAIARRDRVDALVKLARPWFALRAEIERLIEESYRLTDHLVAGIERREVLELASTPETNVVCFRANPGDGSDVDALNAALRDRLLREHDVFLSLPTYRGSRWLRAVLLNPHTDEAVLDRLLDGIDGFLETA